ncbi:MAG: type II toxin-antitoxin system Phd/YefM family antitoxin [Leptospirales bacterium]|nr:type II toxin-antitoxin system Phd/YefM family antitoxin [Leptospirales bacterium]
MPVLNVNSAKEKLDIILEEVQNTYEPLLIAGEKYSAVLISEELWRSIEETLYLLSIPGMKESIIAGMKEKIEDCVSTIEWEVDTL